MKPVGAVPVKGLTTPVQAYERPRARRSGPGYRFPPHEALPPLSVAPPRWQPSARRSRGLRRATARWWRLWASLVWAGHGLSMSSRICNRLLAG